MPARNREPRPHAAVPSDVTEPRPQHPSALAVCALPAEEEAVSQARAFVGVQLTAWRIGEEVVDAARLVVSEFVTNTVRHSPSADVSLRLTRSRAGVWIEVFDSGTWRPPATGGPYDDLSEGGRGLMLVQALSRQCGVHRTAYGTCAWATMPEHPPGGRRARTAGRRAPRTTPAPPPPRTTARP
ncbi:ATP-binding protein [Streptomyces cyanogenus]|uniref:Histidine kinase-, DNA gyrase B-, and HSP90-like ATPase n=1 Tax=Streptomyces cyanogenus TaxID=80860 RepID=A0ABX7TN81_STRCY|nr:ATP-binding protein [Streptomyces cyanogenus]QTD98185.1 Histidine kinase-, DNA gyrase B-, and HSP90-like ATPase [Streptomyces cyanogenus]